MIHGYDQLKGLETVVWSVRKNKQSYITGEGNHNKYFQC